MKPISAMMLEGCYDLVGRIIPGGLTLLAVSLVGNAWGLDYTPLTVEGLLTRTNFFAGLFAVGVFVAMAFVVGILLERFSRVLFGGWWGRTLRAAADAAAGGAGLEKLRHALKTHVTGGCHPIRILPVHVRQNDPGLWTYAQKQAALSMMCGSLFVGLVIADLLAVVLMILKENILALILSQIAMVIVVIILLSSAKSFWNTYVTAIIAATDSNAEEL